MLNKRFSRRLLIPYDVWLWYHVKILGIYIILIQNDVIRTATTESRAATAKMSAHETTGPPQALSTSSLMLSTTSNPPREFWLGKAFFSLSMVGVGSRRTEASQPCHFDQNKK